jgi:methylmalonyl-CoA carboxyltransferase small subunit
LKLKLTVDGKVYEVEVEVPEPDGPTLGHVPAPGQVRVPASPAAVPAPAPQAPKATVPSGEAASESKVCRSPFSGTVARVLAQVGQVIQVNDVLMVLEAMKMETMITAPIAGKVARITVNPGDAVQQGQVLVEFA